jgi:hypothetical protein
MIAVPVSPQMRIAVVGSPDYLIRVLERSTLGAEIATLEHQELAGACTARC